MEIIKSFFLVIVRTFIVLFFGFCIWPNLIIPAQAYAEEVKISQEAIAALSKTGQAMAEIAAAVRPAIVNIASTDTVKTQEIRDPSSRNEYGQYEKPRERRQASLASGVIVSEDGYILTNNHVIQNPDNIKVRLSDKREFKGRVIGTDPKTDLAVIKIEAKQLTALKIGDSDKLRVGETVIAIGNPFGLSQTVTSGIVSATGRANVGIAEYEDFIQTDAPINPGNSGGALVNVRGELIGINTAIFSTTGGHQGIGFSIPSNMAKVVMESLIQNGKVIRGWFGASAQSLTTESAKIFNLNDKRGALIGDVFEGSPAEKAGLKRGDVIIEFNGKEIDEPLHLRNMVANTVPNTKVTMKIIRNGNAEIIEGIVEQLPIEMLKSFVKVDNYINGVHVQNLAPELKKSLDIPRRITGVAIIDIADGTPADGILMKGDVIMEIDKKIINNTKDFDMAVSNIMSGQTILLLIYRNDATTYITLPGE
ncbi:MAG: DegQ family serine endoprotease [Thermodesulfovibrionales bacterium]